MTIYMAIFIGVLVFTVLSTINVRGVNLTRAQHFDEEVKEIFQVILGLIFMLIFLALPVLLVIGMFFYAARSY